MVEIDGGRQDNVGDTESAKDNGGDYDFSVYEEGETKFKPSRVMGGKHLGCFEPILMYFVHKNNEKTRRNQKSFISRNQQFRKELSKSVKKLKERTVSMMSIASTNWKESRLNLASSMTNLTGRYGKKNCLSEIYSIYK